MNPLIQSKNATILPVLIALTLGCFALSPQAQSVSDATYAAARVAAPSQSRQLFFEDRVAYQRAIEEVYWRHRIWPKERPDRKPSLDAVMSQATIEQRVQDYLRHSELLEQSWQKPITPGQLRAEMERMAQWTMSDVPRLIAEGRRAATAALDAVADDGSRPGSLSGGAGRASVGIF